MNTPISSRPFRSRKTLLLLIAGTVAISLFLFLMSRYTTSRNTQIAAISNNEQVNPTAVKNSPAMEKKGISLLPPHNNPKTKNFIVVRKGKSDTGVNPDPSVVKRLLLKRGIYFGDFLNDPDIRLDPPRPKNFLEEVNKYFNLYTIPAFFNHIENKGPGRFDFGPTDRVADFAVAHGAKIHGHNMVWINALPDWLKKGHFTPDQLSDILKNHIQTVIRHYNEKYPGAVVSWDIVNECISDSENLDPKLSYPNGLRKNVPLWSVIHKPGSTDPTDYIQLAFEWAHEAAPNVKLYWNEYNTEYNGFKMNRWFNIVNELKNKGVPIDGVGFQTHLSLAYNHPLDELRENMDRFASIGLECRVSELDVSMSSTSILQPPYHPTYLNSSTVNSPMQSDYEHQAAIYRGVIDACLNAKNCKALTVWGVWDPATWLDINSKDKDGKMLGPFYPDVLDKNMKPKLAFKALVDEVNAKIPQ